MLRPAYLFLIFMSSYLFAFAHVTDGISRENTDITEITRLDMALNSAAHNLLNHPSVSKDILSKTFKELQSYLTENVKNYWIHQGGFQNQLSRFERVYRRLWNWHDADVPVSFPSRTLLNRVDAIRSQPEFAIVMEVTAVSLVWDILVISQVFLTITRRLPFLLLGLFVILRTALAAFIFYAVFPDPTWLMPALPMYMAIDLLFSRLGLAARSRFGIQPNRTNQENVQEASNHLPAAPLLFTFEEFCEKLVSVDRNPVQSVEDCCLICFDDYSPDNPRMKYHACSHGGHARCLYNWHKIWSWNCYICRRNLTAVQEGDNNQQIEMVDIEHGPT